MKYISLIFLFAALSVNSIYAQGCQINEDPFTNEKVITYNWKQGIVFYEQTPDHTKFGIRIHYDGEQNVVFEKGNQLLFKLDNDEVLTLTTCADAVPETKISANQYSAAVYTAYTFVFYITPEQLKKLADHRLTAVRYPDANGEKLDIFLKGKRNKYSKAVQEGGQCIIGHS